MKNKNALAIPFIILLAIVGAVIAWYFITSNAGVSSNPKDLNSAKPSKISKGLKMHTDPTGISSGKYDASSDKSSGDDLENAEKSREDGMKQLDAGKNLIKKSLTH